MTALTKDHAEQVYSSRINFWGRITVSAGLLLSLAGPVYLFVFQGMWPGWGPILASFVAVALIFGVNWIVEPATYFPMLGVTGTYQAWLVGNISNKLLPASVTAQAATDTKPGTKRAELIAVAAISGAVIVHVTSLILIVALLGNWIVSILPESIRATFDYILPAVIGAVFVQIVAVVKEPIVTVAAVLLGAFGVFVFPQIFPSFTALALPLAVIGTVLLMMYIGARRFNKSDKVKYVEE